MIKITGLIIIMLLGVNAASSQKIVPLPDLLQPELVRVDEKQMYISEGPRVYIYSLRDFRLLKKFGKRGEGPQEVLTGRGAVGLMWMEIQEDYIFLHSMSKISYFSKNGTYIKEKKITLAHGPVLHPIGNRFVGIGFPNEKGKRYWTTNIYDANLKIIKEIHRYERGFYPDRDIDLLAIKTPDFCVHNKKIFVADTVKTGEIYVFDLNGNLLNSIKPRCEKIAITDEDEKRLRYNFSTGERKAFYKFYEKKIKAPRYFPAMRFLSAADGKLYIMTYKRKEDKTQFLIFTGEGKFLKNVFLPVKDLEVRYYCPYDIKNNTLYHLCDNEETGNWELHIAAIE